MNPFRYIARRRALKRRMAAIKAFSEAIKAGDTRRQYHASKRLTEATHECMKVGA